MELYKEMEEARVTIREEAETAGAAEGRRCGLRHGRWHRILGMPRVQTTAESGGLVLLSVVRLGNGDIYIYTSPMLLGWA